MQEAKNTVRAIVHIGYDGLVYKTFRGTHARERFENEVRVLKYLEGRGCGYVPRLVSSDSEKLSIVTTNCGTRVEQISDARVKELFDELERDYGVRHDDAFSRNITYRRQDGRFCLIDFELATILDQPRTQPWETPASPSPAPDQPPSPSAPTTAETAAA